MAQSTAQVGNLNITTQVVPGTNSFSPSAPVSPKNFVPVISKHFKKTPVKALSTVLMLTGILQLSFGFVMFAAENKQLSLTVRSGVSLWAGLVVFIAGCTLLIALLKDTVDMIKVCMVCNIINVTVATVGLILYAIQIYGETQNCWVPVQDSGRNMCDPGPNSYYYYREDITQLRISIISMLMIFSLLGLVISCVISKVSDKALKASGYSLLRAKAKRQIKNGS
ncbi:uncharacterized protein PAF06_001065 [Gastrophryne carolinensis]